MDIKNSQTTSKYLEEIEKELPQHGSSNAEIENILSLYPLYFYGSLRSYQSINPPPPSPGPAFSFETKYCILPEYSRTLEDLEIPIIRETGVKLTVEKLADYFKCSDYKINLVQFWFLDIVADCLWRLQDEFQFPKDYQKTILSWVLYIFDLIRDTTLNLSRGRLFEIFKEVMEAAEKYVETGSALLTPEEMFSLHIDIDNKGNINDDINNKNDIIITESTYNKSKPKLVDINEKNDSNIKDSMYNKSKVKLDDKSNININNKSKVKLDDNNQPMNQSKSNINVKYSKIKNDKNESNKEKEDSSSSSCSLDSSVFVVESRSDILSYVAVKLEENTEYLQLPERNCAYDDECWSSSIETPSEHSIHLEEEEEEEETETTETLSRNLACIQNSHEEMKKINIKGYNWKYIIPEKMEDMCFSETFIEPEKISEHVVAEKRVKSNESKIMVGGKMTTSKEKNIGQQRKSLGVQEVTDEDVFQDNGMTDEEVMEALFQYNIWQKRLEDMDDPEKGWVPDDTTEQNSIFFTESKYSKPEDDVLNEWENYLKDYEKSIKQKEKNIFINSCALMAIKQFIFDYFYETFQYSLLQYVFKCEHYYITQTLNDKWCIPKVIKGDIKRPQYKKPKVDKPKKDKSKKSSKSKKGKSKSSKSKSKKSKSTKSKKSSKGSKKGKVKKLTKEEKEELARIKREQELLEEEMFRAAENRFYMFPLDEATNDDFYKGIFENWTRPEVKEKGKKGKKEKGKKKKK